MNKNILLGIAFYIAGLCFAGAVVVHYKNAGLVSALIPLIAGSMCIGAGSVTFYLSKK